MRTGRAETILKWLLIVLGALAALAVIPIVMPFAWMQAGNTWLGLEPLERTPLAQYMTRSLSALYALFGALMIYLGLNVWSYHHLIVFFGFLTAILGVVLTGIDLAAGLPASWTWGEGPPTVLAGWAICWLARRVASDSTSIEDVGSADGANRTAH